MSFQSTFIPRMVFFSAVFASLSLLSMPCAARPQVWIFPPGRDKGQNFRDLFDHPEMWQQTRSRIDVLGYADHVLNKQFTDQRSLSCVCVRITPIWSSAILSLIPAFRLASS
jgi:hypothetical protein